MLYICIYGTNCDTSNQPTRQEALICPNTIGSRSDSLASVTFSWSETTCSMSLRQSIYREYRRSQPLRNFHGSRPCHDLVAPPHPVSHFRPIIYGDASSQPPPTYLRHPYSLSEFTTGTGSTLGDHELQFLLQRQQLDTFHHSFWLDVGV